jgi:hypothetical protein
VAVARITHLAQEELRQLQPDSGSAIPSPENLAAFHEKMRTALPEQRQQLIEQRHEAMIAARAQQEASLTPEDRQQRDRLQKITQLSGLLFSARQSSWAGELRAQSDAFEKAITRFAAEADSLSEENFATAWTDLQQSHQALCAQGQGQALQQSIQQLATAPTP